MRLIDVDNYCENICRCNAKKCNKGLCPIHNAPTAYDADKIVEQIGKRIENAKKAIVESPADKLDKIANDAAEDFIQAYEECIEIIRKGGIS